MKRFNVLIVEDNLDHQKIIKKFIIELKKPKINAIFKVNGKSAYEYLKVHLDINLIILDIKLPDFSGDTILRYIRSNKNYKKKPVIVFTSSYSVADKTRCSDYKVNDYIIKPEKMSPETLKGFNDAIIKHYKSWKKKRR